MANKRRTTSWQSGQSGNPNGRPKLSLAEKTIKGATRTELSQAVENIHGLNLVALRKLVNSNKDPWIYVAVARAALEAAETGDFSKLDRVLDRIIGKPKQELKHIAEQSHDVRMNVEVTKVLKELPQDELIAMAKEAAGI